MIETDGQKPITGLIATWLVVLVLGWAANSVIIKLIVGDIPPFWAASLRFILAFPLLVLFVILKKVTLRTNLKELFQIAFLALLTYIQIALFNSGSRYTTGGRITLFIFTYPLMVPILAHFVIKSENLKRKTLIGCFLAFIGLVLPLHHSIFNDSSTLKGDLMELGSCVSLVFLVVFTKKIISRINKWRVIFWQSIIAISLFLSTAFLFEKLDITAIKSTTVYAMIYQSVVINTFCFLSYQYILSKHNSSQVAVFFFATPLLGMLIGVAVLKEKFEWILLAGCIFVGAGIYIANKKKKKTTNPELSTPKKEASGLQQL